MPSSRNAERRIGLAAIGLLLAAGCATAPSRFYTLQSTAAAAPAGSVATSVVVGPITVPGSVDRPEIVVQDSPNRVTLDEFNRWAAPVGESIARVVAGDLAAQLGTPRVATAPIANFEPAYRVTIDVQRFESAPGDSALLDAVWVVRRTDDGTTRSGRTVAREPVSGPGYDALAAAHSRALEKLSADVAAAIESLAAAPSAAARDSDGKPATTRARRAASAQGTGTTR